jgi:hypothetical protein
MTEQLWLFPDQPPAPAKARPETEAEPAPKKTKSRLKLLPLNDPRRPRNRGQAKA